MTVKRQRSSRFTSLLISKSYWFDKPRFVNEGKLLLTTSPPSLGALPNAIIIRNHISTACCGISGGVAVRKAQDLLGHLGIHDKANISWRTRVSRHRALQPSPFWLLGVAYFAGSPITECTNPQSGVLSERGVRRGRVWFFTLSDMDSHDGWQRGFEAWADSTDQY